MIMCCGVRMWGIVVYAHKCVDVGHAEMRMRVYGMSRTYAQLLLLYSKHTPLRSPFIKDQLPLHTFTRNFCAAQYKVVYI